MCNYNSNRQLKYGSIESAELIARLIRGRIYKITNGWWLCQLSWYPFAHIYSWSTMIHCRPFWLTC